MLQGGLFCLRVQVCANRTQRPPHRSLCPAWLLLPAALLLSGCAGAVKDTRHSFKTVVIDAGHGGQDSGAHSRRALLEKTVALDVAKRVEEKVRTAGFHTVMTRSDDRFIPLPGRVSLLNRQTNAIFVSIHFNCARSSRPQGVETYYHHPYGRDLANRIQSNLLRVAGPDRGVKPARFHVLRNARYPAALVECGFLTNPRDERLARSADYRDRLATQITRGILDLRGRKP